MSSFDEASTSGKLQFRILAKCSTTRARVAHMSLAHGVTLLPTFMPVATQASIKGLTSQQMEELGFDLILNNTYHLGLRPGTEVLEAAGGAHAFQDWKHNLLTDSGGFQLVSLVKLSTMTEQGVRMQSPFHPDDTSQIIVLTPEESMRIQHAIGADIMMQLDDVIVTTSPDRARMEEAVWRSVRWLDRCIAYHKASGKDQTQNLFAIVQGGLDPALRDQCLDAMIERSADVPGYAVGGLSGGEAKDSFWRVVAQCTAKLPEDKPRYCMGVGFAEDLLVCIALGVDMADCVFPTRTARFGIALTFSGPMNIALQRYAEDFSVIDGDCICPTCRQGKGLSRSLLHSTLGKVISTASSLTLHNLAFQFALMKRAREAIIEDRFPLYLKSFFRSFYGQHINYPAWAVDALRSVNVDLLEDAPPNTVPRAGNAPRWEYAPSTTGI